jgi:6-phosphogluconolactonase (cycloisomerase 2 family)
MKFTKFGKALLMSALSVAIIFGVSSCVESYTVGFLYVTGTLTAGTAGQGIISGFKIDHNTGRLKMINTLPVSSGGSYPVRAVLITGSRFLYVLNKGTNASGGTTCTPTDPCSSANITQFAVGGNGVLTIQDTYFTQGLNPFRMIADAAGDFLYVLDHDSPSAVACAQALGAGVNTCADITAFAINATTGRLQLVTNAQVTSANCANNGTSCPLPYFPVPANPIDFSLSAGYILTLSGTPDTGDSVFPYTYNQATGQLTINQNTSQPLGIAEGTAIVNGGSFVYVLDNEGTLVQAAEPGATSQILPFSVGSNGALDAQTGGIVPDDPTLSNPIYLIVESKGKFAYVINQGNNAQGTNAQSGIAGYVLDPTTHQLTFIAGEPFGSGGGPQCLVEDPSDQFVYSADFNDSAVTGRLVDPNSGELDQLRVPSTFALGGPATWCLVDGRTS